MSTVLRERTWIFSSDLAVHAIQAVCSVCWECIIGVSLMRLFQGTPGASVLLVLSLSWLMYSSSMDISPLELERFSARGCIHNSEGICELSKTIP